jgi:hypothetical protein
MRRILSTILLSLSAFIALAQTSSYDVVIVGGTPGGIMAAIAASREGKTAVLLERSTHAGGLPVNGLGATDIATRGATTGLFKEFVDNILEYYVDKYGEGSPQVIACSNGYHFEPHVAGIVLENMLKAEGRNVMVLTRRQFDALPENVEKDGEVIKSIRILNLKTKKQEIYSGKIFIDATYEGDLGAASGVPYSLGREGEDEYGEIGAGRLFKLWRGPEIEGTTHEGDDAVQAYNYRLCLTNDPDNRILSQKPKGYKRSDYASIVDDVYYGIFAGAEMLDATAEMHEENKRHIEEGGKTQIPGDPWGIAKVTNMVKLPNQKTDANNQHLALVSTDLPEENWKWPTADWKWRDKFAQRLKEYTIGLLWFAQNDKALPEEFRRNASEWGFAKDEYQDNDNFPRQVYVREGRRLHGKHIFTANDALPAASGKRPPIYSSSITASHYALDSHAARKREKGRIALDGFFSYPSAPYTVPYEVIVPERVDNLLIPVPASATHVGFSTLRMEPCWMALGQAAGIAASIAIDNGTAMADVPIQQLQEKLLDGGATLIYFKDLSVTDPDFKMAQEMALKGYLSDWNANLDSTLDASTARLWQELSGIKINNPENKTRRSVLRAIYEIAR